MTLKEKLLILADYVEKNVSDEHFDMACYVGDVDFDINKSITECGTVGCLLGHATHIEELKYNDNDLYDSLFNAQKEIDYERYCERVFEIQEGSDEYEFLFSSSWSHSKYWSRKDAINRIRMFCYNDCELSDDMRKCIE